MISVFLMVIWLGFSDKRDLFHLLSGVGASLLVAGLTCGVLLLGVRRGRRGRLAARYVFSFPWHRLLVFLPWLLLKVLLANVEVARLILDPRLPIDPDMVRVKSGLHGDVARMALASVITLTPGTCVVEIDGDEFVVHKIHPASAAPVVSREMIEMVSWTFELAEDREWAGGEREEVEGA